MTVFIYMEGQTRLSRADANQALAMMVNVSLYFIMFASFLARITIHVYQLGCLLIDNYLLIKLIGSSVVVYTRTRKKRLRRSLGFYNK